MADGISTVLGLLVSGGLSTIIVARAAVDVLRRPARQRRETLRT